MVVQEFGHEWQQKGSPSRRSPFLSTLLCPPSALATMREPGSSDRAAQRSCTFRGDEATTRSSGGRRTRSTAKARARVSPLVLLKSLHSTGIRFEDTISRCGKRAVSACCASVSTVGRRAASTDEAPTPPSSSARLGSAALPVVYGTGQGKTGQTGPRKNVSVTTRGRKSGLFTRRTIAEHASIATSKELLPALSIDWRECFPCLAFATTMRASDDVRRAALFSEFFEKSASGCLWHRTKPARKVVAAIRTGTVPLGRTFNEPPLPLPLRTPALDALPPSTRESSAPITLASNGSIREKQASRSKLGDANSSVSLRARNPLARSIAPSPCSTIRKQLGQEEILL